MNGSGTIVREAADFAGEIQRGVMAMSEFDYGSIMRRVATAVCAGMVLAAMAHPVRADHGEGGVGAVIGGVVGGCSGRGLEG